MKVLSSSVPIFTSDFEAAIERYEASLAEDDAHLRSTGATTLQGPSPTPAGTHLIGRDVEGVVVEFVEHGSKE